uniref:Uncharacterized protein n=1 Tax=Glossina palpalis gambiensis TaxID=67801 RepID=A0A1B0BXW5_9MUSC
MGSEILKLESMAEGPLGHCRFISLIGLVSSELSTSMSTDFDGAFERRTTSKALSSAQVLCRIQSGYKAGPCMCAWACLHFLWELSGEMYILKQTLALTTADIAIAILTVSNAIGDIATSSIVTLGNVLSTFCDYQMNRTKINAGSFIAALLFLSGTGHFIKDVKFMKTVFYGTNKH